MSDAGAGMRVRIAQVDCEPTTSADSPPNNHDGGDWLRVSTPDPACATAGGAAPAQSVPGPRVSFSRVNAASLRGDEPRTSFSSLTAGEKNPFDDMPAARDGDWPSTASSRSSTTATAAAANAADGKRPSPFDELAAGGGGAAAESPPSCHTTNNVRLARDELGELTDMNNYHIVRHLGSGSFADVYLASNEGDFYAVKCFDKAHLSKKRSFYRGSKGRMVVSTAMDQVKTEIAIMKKLKHKNLVQLHEIIDDEHEDQMFMVLEFVDGGNLMDWDENAQRFTSVRGGADGLFSERSAARCVVDILDGLLYLHLHHICHRDLKPENVLITAEGQCKIADFGVAHYFKEEEDLSPEQVMLTRQERSKSLGQLTRTEGTYYFWAPEMCAQGSYSGYATDMWAVGICLFGMVFGSLPFVGSNPIELFANIQDGELAFSKPISPELEQFLRGLLAKDPTERLTIDEAIEHPWLTSYAESGRLSIDSPTLRRVKVTQGDIDAAIGCNKTNAFLTPKGRRLTTLSRDDIDHLDDQPTNNTGRRAGQLRRVRRSFNAKLLRANPSFMLFRSMRSTRNSTTGGGGGGGGGGDGGAEDESKDATHEPEPLRHRTAHGLSSPNLSRSHRQPQHQPRHHHAQHKEEVEDKVAPRHRSVHSQSSPALGGTTRNRSDPHCAVS